MVWLVKCWRKNSLFKVLVVVALSLGFSLNTQAMSFFAKPPDQSPLLKKFKTQVIEVGSHQLSVYVASTDPEHSQGLMFVEKLGENEGMLFVFSDEAPRSFWMKNTKIDLDIGYFDKDGVLKDIQQMQAGYGKAESRLVSYLSRAPAKYALEMNQGWFEKHRIKVGDKLKINPSKVQ